MVSDKFVPVFLGLVWLPTSQHLRHRFLTGIHGPLRGPRRSKSEAESGGIGLASNHQKIANTLILGQFHQHVYDWLLWAYIPKVQNAIKSLVILRFLDLCVKAVCQIDPLYKILEIEKRKKSFQKRSRRRHSREIAESILT